MYRYSVAYTLNSNYYPSYIEDVKSTAHYIDASQIDLVYNDNIYSKSQSSTGLGLPITKELVKLHNGKITLESELNNGTTFIMEFKKIIL